MGGNIEIKEKYIIVLDFDVAKKYNFGYNKPMTYEHAKEVQEFIFRDTGQKFPLLDFTTLHRKEDRHE